MFGRLRSLAILTVLAAATTSCGGPAATRPSPPRPRVSPDMTPEELLAELTTQARSGSVTMELNGREILDPFRLLESDGELTRAWIDAQTAYAAVQLERWSGPTAAIRLRSLLAIGSIGGAKVAGRRIFFEKREGDREQAALYVADGLEVGSEPIIDPATFGPRAVLDWYYPSPSGRHVAFGISENGDERSTLHVLDVNTGSIRDEQIPHTKWSHVEWPRTENGFYYTRYPRPAEPGYDEDNPDTTFPRIFFHALGDDPGTDPLIFGADQAGDFPSMSLSDDDRYLVINVFRGWSTSAVSVFDRGPAANRRIRPAEDEPLIVIEPGFTHMTAGRVHRGVLFLMTNAGSPHYRIDGISLRRPIDPRARRIIIAETDATIEDWKLVADRIVLHYITDVHSKLSTFRLNGRASGDIALPGMGSIGEINGGRSGFGLAFTYSDYAHPPTLLRVDVRRLTLETVDQARTEFPFDRFAVDRATVRSEDGTEIPITVLHARNLPRDGNRPVLAYGYGGFNLSLLPEFTRHALYFVERGGVYVVANLRGGGEGGEDWHRAGNLEKKTNVFADFEAVLRWLVTENISNPNRIAIMGRSNGGLLVGALVARSPQLFRAATAYVGLYDMLRYHRFPPGELWVPEYGSADDPEQAEFLYAYSPYHQIRDNTPYPSVLIETADHDSRVYWGHSTKMAARLQEATSSDHPVLFFMERAMGHGHGTRLSDLVARYVRAYSFIEHELGMTDEPSPSLDTPAGEDDGREVTQGVAPPPATPPRP